MSRVFAALLTALVAWPTVAFAKPMQFTLSEFQPPAGVVVIASGTIDESTPAAFLAFEERLGPGRPITDVLFRSDGGNLDPALALGRILRSRRISTGLALENGYCRSACAYAFLGGLTRFAGLSGGQQDVLGFHQFSAGLNAAGLQSMAKKRALVDDVSGHAQGSTSALAAYVEEMGVSVEIIRIASRALPGTMVYPDVATLKHLRVLFEGDDQWTFTMSSDLGRIVSIGLSADTNHRKQVTFGCFPDSNNKNQPAIVLSLPKGDYPASSYPLMIGDWIKWEKLNGSSYNEKPNGYFFPDQGDSLQQIDVGMKWIGPAYRYEESGDDYKAVEDGEQEYYSTETWNVIGITFYADEEWANIVAFPGPYFFELLQRSGGVEFTINSDGKESSDHWIRISEIPARPLKDLMTAIAQCPFIESGPQDEDSDPYSRVALPREKKNKRKKEAKAEDDQ
ncbi:hypothetical protein [Sphingomonas kyeonggiensis]|uniref:Periplasmic protein n=1 Tax=Sphingomonas kyeonggiensis TaxID=1268553 RepID=A0A7W6NWG6_9SPHN|nr:hypothetical protein [Sphingomonas kyeonggiensis]MBB4097626.1 hypothetical protein [Sphingomonas kyeonggiensis]